MPSLNAAMQGANKSETRFRRRIGCSSSTHHCHRRALSKTTEVGKLRSLAGRSWSDRVWSSAWAIPSLAITPPLGPMAISLFVIQLQHCRCRRLGSPAFVTHGRLSKCGGARLGGFLALAVPVHQVVAALPVPRRQARRRGRRFSAKQSQGAYGSHQLNQCKQAQGRPESVAKHRPEKQTSQPKADEQREYVQPHRLPRPLPAKRCDDATK